LTCISCSPRGSAEIRQRLLLLQLPVPSPSVRITGVAQKGGFLSGSSISLYELNQYANPADKNYHAKIINDRGDFSLGHEISGWAELKVSGQFLDEFSGSKTNPELELNHILPISAVADQQTHINLFTQMLSARLRILVDGGDSLEVAREKAQYELKNLFGLVMTPPDMGQLDLYDGSGEYKDDNAKLLLFSGAFMAAGGTNANLMQISDDFADNGLIDGKAINQMKSISNFAGQTGLLDRLAANLQQVDIVDPPDHDDLQVFPEWINQQPVVSIHPLVSTVVENSSFTLSASLSSDPEGQALSYQWSGEGTGSCSNSNLCRISALPLGEHEIQVKVRDALGSEASQMAVVKVIAANGVNNPPVASLIASVAVVETGEPITLDASSSSDPDGDILSYQWIGEGVDACGNASVCEISTTSAGIKIYSVKVSDGEGAEDSRSVSVSVVAPNLAPVAVAGQDVSIFVGQSVSLSATSSYDVDGQIISYQWRNNGILVGSNREIALADLTVGTHSIILTVKDDDGATASDSVIISVKAVDVANKPPVANAGTDLEMNFGDNVQLSAAASSDPDGQIVSYHWKEGSKLIGSGLELALDSLSIGTHIITLIVTDDKGASDNDNVTVTVLGEAANQLPVANAGFDQEVYESQSITFTAEASYDPDGSIVSYSWSKNGDVFGSTETVTIPGSELGLGRHQITLKVIDDREGSDQDSVVVTVKSHAEISINTPSATRCTYQVGSYYLATYSFFGGVTGNGNISLQKYSGEGCTGSKINDPIESPLTYTLYNISVKQDGTIIADMEVVAFGLAQTRKVKIVGGVVSL
jgi:hypothetical protein